MGYSATSKAFKVLNFISDQIYNEFGYQNTWENNGKQYFYEIGNENADGSITGSVSRIEGGYVYTSSGFKIDAQGQILRFPNLPKNIKKAAIDLSNHLEDSFYVIS